jgi:hypothetical protein
MKIVSSPSGICRILLALFFAPVALFGGVFTVTTTNPTGPGSLAQAVADANHASGPSLITFAIPGPGVHKIDLSNTPLLVASQITIDGYTQPGASPNTLDLGDNAVILIQLDGGGPAILGAGLGFVGDEDVIRGLSLTGFDGALSFGNAFEIFGKPSRVEGNFIGLSPDGITVNGNYYGIVNINSDPGLIIGGGTPATRNIISGNVTGVWGDVGVFGNYFGTDASGFGQGYGNDIAIEASPGSGIGTAAPGDGNVITGSRIGIVADSGDSIIKGNWIGPYPDGSASFGNFIGIEIRGSQNNIGGLGSGEGNVIAFNGVGVRVDPTSSTVNRPVPVGNSILSNLFYHNGRDIDLGADGITRNDFHDQDSGANKLQNFPIITSVSRDSSGTTVTGALNSAPSTSFTLQFFAQRSGPTPGETLLGTKTLTTDSAGDAYFALSFPIVTSPDDFITATATDADGNTSEFFAPGLPVEIVNVSSRDNVGTGDNILIAGFTMDFGTRKFLIRGLGPSLNIPGALSDPLLEVRGSASPFSPSLFASNDNWRDSQEQEIRATGLAPTNDKESAVLVDLFSGMVFNTIDQTFTAQLKGANGATGIGTLEIYALGSSAPKLLNVSTRGTVGIGDSVLILGTIVQGSATQRVMVRAIGPDLAAAGVPNALNDPTLELRDGEGNLLASNDDWRSDQEQEIIAAGLAPKDDRDSAIIANLFPTSYTAIVRGKNNSVGIGLVEIYALN